MKKELLKSLWVFPKVALGYELLVILIWIMLKSSIVGWFPITLLRVHTFMWTQWPVLILLLVGAIGYYIGDTREKWKFHKGMHKTMSNL